VTGPRVVLVAPVFPQASETFIVTKFAGLVGLGWDVHVVCDRRRDDLWSSFPELAGLGSRVHERPDGMAPGALAGGARAAARAGAGGRRRAAAYLRSRGLAGGRGPLGLVRDAPLLELGPDLIHVEFGAAAVGRTYLGPALGDIPMTVSFRGYDLAYVGLDDPNHYQELWDRVAAVHCLGADLWQRAVARGCPPDLPHQLIPPGVDLTRFGSPAVPRAGALGTEADPIHLLSIGRLEWKKGYQWGIRAVRRLVDDGLHVRWRIVGTGDLTEAVAFERSLLGLDGVVELLGHVPVADVVEQLRWADLLLHPAISEGFGNAVLEAQAMGVPVVATDADGLAENVADGETGLIVPRRDPEALAAAVAALAADGERRAAMAAAGRPRVATHFGLEANLAAWDRFYRTVLGRGPEAEGVP